MRKQKLNFQIGMLVFFSPFVCCASSTTTKKTLSFGSAVSEQLTEHWNAKIARMKPGDRLVLPSGKILGGLKIAVSGSREQPLELIGSQDTVILGKSFEQGVGMLITGSNWIIRNIAIQRFKKGVVLERSTHVSLLRMRISEIGEEGVHFRGNSSRNLIGDSTIKGTGLWHSGFGEGIYVGSAKNHWCDYSNCQPDRSDQNRILRNFISATRAENIDVKEGTTATQIEENTLDGSSMMGENFADSHIDIKGNNSVVVKNIFSGNLNASLLNYVQIHERVKGWGSENKICENDSQVVAAGFGVSDQTKVKKNVVCCNNRFSLAALGISDPACK